MSSCCKSGTRKLGLTIELASRSMRHPRSASPGASSNGFRDRRKVARGPWRIWILETARASAHPRLHRNKQVQGRYGVVVGSRRSRRAFRYTPGVDVLHKICRGMDGTRRAVVPCAVTCQGQRLKFDQVICRHISILAALNAYYYGQQPLSSCRDRCPRRLKVGRPSNANASGSYLKRKG